tara:strand:+ start:304 stop:645 length:342 start_codon:yes stop_codon:yes gene_type:complete
MKIYHNPRCSKSRQALSILQENGIDTEIIEYLKEPITKDIIKDLIKKLNILPKELIRTNEEIWKTKGRNQGLDGDEIIELMVNHPRLIERPIVVNGKKAIIGRPPEDVLKIIN